MTWVMERIAGCRTCFHHDHRRGESWIRSQIIDWRKLYDCGHCGKTWVI